MLTRDEESQRSARRSSQVERALRAREVQRSFHDRVLDGLRRFFEDHAMAGKTGAQDFYDFEKELHARLMEGRCREELARATPLANGRTDRFARHPPSDALPLLLIIGQVLCPDFAKGQPIALLVGTTQRLTQRPLATECREVSQGCSLQSANHPAMSRSTASSKVYRTTPKSTWTRTKVPSLA